MSKHYVIRIRKPSLAVSLSICVGGAAALCTWLFVKRMLSRRSRQQESSLDQSRSQVMGSETYFGTQNHFEDSFSVRSPMTLFSNRISCSRAISRPGSVNTSTSVVVDCGTIGLRTLDRVVDQLEDCIRKINRMLQQTSTNDPSSEVFIKELQKFLETSYLLREQFKRAFIQEVPNNVSEFTCIDSLSDADTDSFFSTVEEIDLSDLDLQMMSHLNHPFYRNALKELNDGKLTFRSVRTEMMNCESDTEYLAKLLCVRRVFDYLLSLGDQVSWLRTVGRAVASSTLLCLGCDPTDFESSYSFLMDYLNSLSGPDAMARFVDELNSKGVQALNFYDIFFDRILIDALENLGDPPSTILALTRNSWLSPSFKRSALDSAVWTLMAAKRKMLKYPDGFFAIYYRVVESVSGALAWGFLGSDESLNAFCESMREEVTTFLRFLFKFAETPNKKEGVTLDKTTIHEPEDSGDTASVASVYLDLNGERNHSEEDDDDTITPEGDEKRHQTALRDSYVGMDFTSVDAMAACVYSNMGTLQRHLSSLISDFAVNNHITLNRNLTESLNLRVPPLPVASNDSIPQM